jgi:glycosyltransferase involved in cell wall biosynthesis
MSIKISTIIPAYNAKRTIAQAIDSALSQDCEGHEVVVVNDGSTDSTPGILESYRDRIQVITQPNRGLSAARNVGVDRSSGEYLAFLDADDILLPGKLKLTIAAFERNPLASLVFTEYRNVDDYGRERAGSSIGHAPSMEELMRRLTEIVPSTWVIPRQIFERTGGFCEEFKGAQGFEDHWMLLVLRETGEFVRIPERLTLYRVGERCKLADKYAPGFQVFISLLKERYGVKGKPLIREAKKARCAWLLCKAAHQIDDGDKLRAVRTLAGIARLRPAYFLGSELCGRVFLPQNLKRLRDLIPVVSRAID